MKTLQATVQAPGEMSSARVLVVLFVVNFVSISGFGMLLPVFAQFGKQIGASGTEIAWAIASFSLGQLLSGALFGRLSDKFGRKPLMVAGMVATSVFYIGHVFATAPALLILVRFCAGMASGSFALSFAVGTDISTPATRARMLGIIGAGFSTGFIFGPAIGGVVAGLVSEESAFGLICVFGAGMSLIAAVATLFMLPETRKQTVHEEGAHRHRMRDLVRQRDFFTVLIICLASTVGMSMLYGVLFLFANDILSLGPLGIGLMYTSMGVCGVAAQAGLVGPVADSIGEHRMLVISMVVVCAGMIAVGSSSAIGLALAGMCAVAIGYSLVTTATTTLASFIAVESLQGAALGVVQAATSLGRFLGPAVAGPLYDMQGPSAPFYWSAALLFLLSIGAALWHPSVGRHPGHAR
jgi:DHA1 family tetracycline resistance protein-like MFS transporter